MSEEALYLVRDDESTTSFNVMNGLHEFVNGGTMEELEAKGFKLKGDFGWYDHPFYDIQLHELEFQSSVTG